MREEGNAFFTHERIETMAHIWARSNISLVDVRHQHIDPKRPLRQYRMPSSMLIYAYGGTANVQLNETIFAMERFGLFHGGKGTLLSVLPDEVMLESYMVLYKAETPSFFKKDLQRLLEQVNPFVQQFGYAPSNPVALLSLFRQMMDRWSGITALNHFQAKNLLSQSMYEIYSDLEREETRFLQPDPVISAKRYLDEHYMRPIMFQEIADLFAISAGQLTRLFKKREGMSLQEYLSLKRLEIARNDLLTTKATVKEIASGCGLIDELNLNRLFKRHYRMTPSEFRKIEIARMQTLDIDNDSHRLYNERGLEDLAKSQRDGEFTMFGQTRSKQMILAAAMSLMLLLSACGTAPASNNGAGTQNMPPAATITQTPAAATKAEAAWPRTINDDLGNKLTLEKKPERVVVMYMGLIESMLVLGNPPIGAPSANLKLGGLRYSGLLEQYHNDVDVIELGSMWEPNLEVILEASPDLIIANNFATMYDDLNAIAPTVVFESADWKEELRDLSKILATEEEADQYIAEIDGLMIEAREKLAVYKDKTFLFTWDRGKGMFGPFGTDMKLFYDAEEGLGLTAPEGLSTKWGEVSLESVANLNPDYIFIVGQSGSEENGYKPSYFADGTEDSSIWKSLKAVQSGNVHLLDPNIAANGPLGTKLAIEMIVDSLFIE